MSTPSTSKTWIVAKKPDQEIADDVFELQTKDLPELKDGEILVEVAYLCGADSSTLRR
jgi:NADPH-dependent curcumin reductase CurA